MEREVCSPQPTKKDTYLPQSNICNVPQELSSRFPSNQKKSTKTTRSTSSTKFDSNLIPILEGFGVKTERGRRNSLPRRLALLRFLPSLPRKDQGDEVRKGRERRSSPSSISRSQKNECENVIGIRAPTSLDKCRLLRLAVSKVLTDGEFFYGGFYIPNTPSPPRTPKPPRKLK